MITAIILYIIIILLLILIKPQFIYDYKTGRLKTFGNNYNQTYYTLPILSIGIAIIISILFIYANKNKNKNS